MQLHVRPGQHRERGPRPYRRRGRQVLRRISCASCTTTSVPGFYVPATDREQADRTFTVSAWPGVPWIHVTDDARGVFARTKQVEALIWDRFGRNV